MMDITAEQLLRAYSLGLFPMAPDRESDELEWFSPQERGIIPLEGFHVPRRLMRTVLSGRYQVCADHDFAGMMNACAAPAPGREETWISPRICTLYEELYQHGFAHSIEVRRTDGSLAGGLYGVALGGAFFGESMVSHERDVSKIALVHLVAALRKGGYRLLDTQYVTPHLSRLGGRAVPLSDYQRRLSEALTVQAIWPGDVDLSALHSEIIALRLPKGGGDYHVSLS
ncbi:leucyl/phenylalanyl-tRNA--protein transferase [Saccharibacter floricola]|nr:leucyl/phenylalanyl-tRNA--protein transferase [Saccharibacter floricola]